MCNNDILVALKKSQIGKCQFINNYMFIDGDKAIEAIHKAIYEKEDEHVDSTGREAVGV